jgi:hypothetical protein
MGSVLPNSMTWLLQAGYPKKAGGLADDRTTMGMADQDEK